MEPTYYTIRQIRDLKQDGKFTWEQLIILNRYKVEYDTIKLSQSILREEYGADKTIEFINEKVTENAERMAEFDATQRNGITINNTQRNRSRSSSRRSSQRSRSQRSSQRSRSSSQRSRSSRSSSQRSRRYYTF